MGITGLLPLLASVTRSTHLAQFAGLRVAIDAYVWLHRGAYGCSFELCQGIGTHKYLAYCMKMVNLLRSYKVIPVLVFDGGNLPSKRGTEATRRDKRKEAKQKGMELLQAGDRKAAAECFQRAVDITPRMAFNLIELLRKEGVEFVVAPYEADAQLTFLCLNGLVDAVISEDSDLIPYGCPRMIYKLDKDGNAEMLRHMCILSGCDYLESLPGMGLKKAHALLLRHGSMGEVFRALENSKMTVPEDYALNFGRADLTFQHQIVYDPMSRKTVHLHPLPEDVDPSTLPFAGEHLDDHIAQLVADGRIDPHSYQPFILSIPMPMPSVPGNLSNSSSFSQGGTQPLSQHSQSSTTPQRLSTQWNTKAMTPLSAAMKQTAAISASSGASRSGMTIGAPGIPTLSQDEVAKHDNDMTRDVRRYTMHRGSSRGVGSAASTASSIIAASTPKQNNTLHAYFASAPKNSTSPSAAAPTGLFRQRSSGLGPASTPTKLSSMPLSPSTSTANIGQVSPLNTSGENSVLRSRFFGAPASVTIPVTTKPPSPSVEQLTEYTAFSWDDENDEGIVLDPELEALIQHGRKAPSTPSAPTTPASKTAIIASNILQTPPKGTPLIPTSKVTTTISLFDDSPSVSQTISPPTTSPKKPQPMRLSIPMKAYSSALNDDSDEEFELVRLDSTTTTISSVPVKKDGSDPFIQVSLQHVEKQTILESKPETIFKERDVELGSDSVVIPVLESDSLVIPTSSKTSLAVSHVSQTGFGASTSEVSLFDDIAEFEQHSSQTPSAQSTLPYITQGTGFSQSLGSSANKTQLTGSIGISTTNLSSHVASLGSSSESGQRQSNSNPFKTNPTFDLSRFIVPIPAVPSSPSRVAAPSSSSTANKTSQSPVSRTMATSSTNTPSRFATKDLSGMIARSPTKPTKKRKDLEREDSIESVVAQTSPPLKMKSPILPRSYEIESVELIDLGD